MTCLWPRFPELFTTGTYYEASYTRHARPKVWAKNSPLFGRRTHCHRQGLVQAGFHLRGIHSACVSTLQGVFCPRVSWRHEGRKKSFLCPDFLAPCVPRIEHGSGTARSRTAVTFAGETCQGLGRGPGKVHAWPHLSVEKSRGMPHALF